MTATAEKQMMMPTISTHMIFSPSRHKPKREIQNGLVCQTTISREMGVRGAARVISTKFAYPKNIRPKTFFFLFGGMSLIGLTLAIRHQMMATARAKTFLYKLKSAWLNPSLATMRNSPVIAVGHMA